MRRRVRDDDDRQEQWCRIILTEIPAPGPEEGKRKEEPLDAYCSLTMSTRRIVSGRQRGKRTPTVAR